MRKIAFRSQKTCFFAAVPQVDTGRNTRCSILVPALVFSCHDISMVAVLVCLLDGSSFPLLNGPCPSPPVGSLEDDSHCMSFAQVCIRRRCTHSRQGEVSSLTRSLSHAQMLRDGRARAEAGPRSAPKKGAKTKNIIQTLDAVMLFKLMIR